MKRKLLVIILYFIGLNIANATAQHAEKITYGGEKYDLLTLMIERCPEYSSLKDSIPTEACSTALWRNYIGHWKIKNDSLFLDSITVPAPGIENMRSLNIDDIFKRKKTPNGYFADWVNDTLRLANGKIVNYVHMAWESTYEHELFLGVKHGIVMSKKEHYNKSITKGISDNEFMKAQSIFANEKLSFLPEGRIIFSIKYTDFSTEGEPIEADIEILRTPDNINLSKQETTKLRKIFFDFMKSVKYIPVYQEYGEYHAPKFIVPFKIIPHKD